MKHKAYRHRQKKGFKKLTKKQKSKLIKDEELENNYENYGLCENCEQPKDNYWCLCITEIFQRHFQNWASGNHIVDKFIQEIQLNAKNCEEIIEWIEYDKFENIEYLAKGGFGTTFKAIWKDGSIKKWDYKNDQWTREKTYFDNPNYPVALKCLHNSQNILAEFLSEVRLLPYLF